MEWSRFVLAVLKETLTLDIWDINYKYSNPAIFKRLLLADMKGLPRKGLLFRLGAFWVNMIRGFRPLDWLKLSNVHTNSILFFAMSKNQKDSLYPVFRHLKKAYFLGRNARHLGRNVDYPISLITFLGGLVSIPFLPLVVYRYWKSEGFRREGFKYNLNKYWLTYGYYIIIRIWLHNRNPKVVIVSNDHNIEQRTIVKAAKDEGITTIYIQHASVTHEFPALSFDYALLEGYDSLRIYDNIGNSQTNIFLIGMPKFDRYLQEVNTNTKVFSIGVCTNWVEPVDRAEQLCQLLREKLPQHKIILRPHPSDSRISEWFDITTRFDINYSDSRIEDSFEFLQKVDVILAGNSSIHLEAALLNVFPIFYDFTLEPRFQTYSFIKTGLCQYVNGPEKAHNLIKELLQYKPSIRYKAKQYCATVDTEYDGRSGELASILINEIAEHQVINVKSSGWNRVHGVDLIAYEISGESFEAK
jgi:hypothetical protein